MKISIDGQEIFSLSETEKKIILNDIPYEIFESDMIRRLRYIIDHPCKRQVEHLKQEWLPKLKEMGIHSVPADPMHFAEVVFSHPENISEDSLLENELSIEIDGKVAFYISSIHRKILNKYLKRKDKEIKESLEFILKHKVERCMQRLRREWEPRLMQKGMSMFPTDDEDFARLVFSQPDYKNRSERND